MIKKDIQNRLDELKRIIQAYETYVDSSMTTESNDTGVIDKFLNDIETAEKKLQSIEDKKLSQLNNEIAFLTKSVQGRILDSMIYTLSPLPDVAPPKLRTELEKSKKQFAKPSLIFSEKKMIAFMIEYRKFHNEEYGQFPPAKIIAEIPKKPHRKAKRRVVEIQPPTNMREQLIQQIDEKKEQLNQLIKIQQQRKEMLSERLKSDSLINQQLLKIENISTLLNEMIDYRKILSETYFKEISTTNNLEKYKEMITIRLENGKLLAAQDEKISHFITEINNATNLITDRIAEIEQIAQIATNKAYESALVKIKKELSDSEAKYNQLKSSIEESIASYKAAPFVKEQVSELLNTHQELKKQFDELVKVRDAKETELTSASSYLAIPLEKDRDSERIKNNNQANTALGNLKEEIADNVLELNKAIEIAEKKRKERAEAVAFLLRSELKDVADDVKKVKNSSVYNDIDLIKNFNLKPELLSSVNEIIRLFESKDPQRTLALIEQEKKIGLKSIQQAIEPLKEAIKDRNNELWDKKEKLIQRVEALEKNTDLSSVTQFSVNDIQTGLKKLPLHPSYSSEIIDLESHERLISLEKQVIEREELANKYLAEIKKRKNSKEALAIQSMINTLDTEITRIKSHGSQDTRVNLLTTIQSGLEHNLSAYLSLNKELNKDATNELIKGSLNTLQNNLTSEKLQQLSNEVINPFKKFIRSILEPLHSLIKDFRGEVYRPHFFANRTENQIGKAAESLRSQLTQIQGEIVKIEPRAPDEPKSATLGS
ncbi:MULTISPECIES: hypothetical protein [unclassified Legionella]|uniref:hypothetical protein n=1 Tax=unclassified Legionella TaxID=2622702 RepID=UPI00105660E7|nr:MULTISPECIES: hypothetical protein [unclassified Legionella]MDI9818812.1 hypothetical protein [Legionella sp. PL877]